MGEFGADDVLVSGEFEERVWGKGDVVGDGRVVVSIDSCLSRCTKAREGLGEVQRTS